MQNDDATALNAPIGIFDSGIGGMTVMKEIVKCLPNENIIYIADSARFPYGTKSSTTITRFAGEIVSFLLQYEVKLVVSACNTASALALPHLHNKFSVPLVGVIEPGAQAAAAATRTGSVGVIGTNATIQSMAYHAALKKINPELRIQQQACPIFVSLVEEGWTDKEVTRLVVEEYLHPFKNSDIDVLLLGCTHYPMLSRLIQEYLGDKVLLVDSAHSCAQQVRKMLQGLTASSSAGEKNGHGFYVTDMPERFKLLGSKILGRAIETVTIVNSFEGLYV